MSIPDTNEGWRKVELKAQLAEAGQIHTEPVPAAPTTAQQLVWAQNDVARAKASIHRKNGAMTEALMFLAIGELVRAQECISKGLLDL